MKAEPISFTPDDSVVAVILSDSTLVVDYIILNVVKIGTTANIGSGYSNGTTSKSTCTLYDTIKHTALSETYCAFAEKNVGGVPTVAIAGKPQVDGFSTPGEIWFDFDNFDANYSVIGLAVGH